MWRDNIMLHILPIERQVEEIRDMMEVLLPEINKNTDIVKYAIDISEKSEYKDVPTSEMYTPEQFSILVNAAKTKSCASIFAALVIGFINGAEWEKRNK